MIRSFIRRIVREEVAKARRVEPGVVASRALRFDLPGAVMTQDLLKQMHAIGDGAAIGGARGGAEIVRNMRAAKGETVNIRTPDNTPTED